MLRNSFEDYRLHHEDQNSCNWNLFDASYLEPLCCHLFLIAIRSISWSFQIF
uniref:Uncharacterized protein MANES_07G107700 n=1 Tax=Rhizophora mucronata TaxID=61149 RepID=A0A2P2JVW8_RHIMU